MQNKIHPKHYPQAEVSCSCGAKFQTGSTLPQIRVEVCSNCHSFYTGQQRFTDEQGTIEKFQARIEKTKAIRTKINAQKKNHRNSKKAKKN